MFLCDINQIEAKPNKDKPIDKLKRADIREYIFVYLHEKKNRD